jgi:putative tricarboxylic transport membrane protein
MGQNASSIYDMEKIKKKKGFCFAYFREFWETRLTLFRSTLIGIIIGILPGAGGTIANVVAYNDAKTYSKKSGFGTGIMDGVVAPESANNATVGGGLIPTLTLGVPGTPVDAIILGALMLHSLQPGPQLFQKSGIIVYSFMWALVISTLMMGVIGLSIGVATYKGVSRVPTRYLAPTIIFLSIIGSYALRNSMADVWMMLALGLIGYGFRLLGMSTSAAVLGLVLGQIAEEGLVQASILSQASSFFKVFFFRPISAIIILLAILTFLWPVLSNLLAKKVKYDDEKRKDNNL